MRLRALLGFGLVGFVLLAGHALATGVGDVTAIAQDTLDSATRKTGTDDLVAQAGGIALGNAFGLAADAQAARAQAVQKVGPIAGDPVATARAAAGAVPSGNVTGGVFAAVDRVPGLLGPVQGDAQQAMTTVNAVVDIATPLAIVQSAVQERTGTTVAFAMHLVQSLTA